MDFLFDHLQIVVIVVAVLISGVTKLREMMGKKEQEEEPWQPQEEDFRPVEEFQPGMPPPDLPRRPAVVPPPLSRYIAAEEPELERQRKMQERLKALRDSKATSTPKSSPKTKAKKSPAPMVSPSKLRDRLRDPQEVRRAIVMREILGPPVGLK